MGRENLGTGKAGNNRDVYKVRGAIITDVHPLTTSPHRFFRHLGANPTSVLPLFGEPESLGVDLEWG